MATAEYEVTDTETGEVTSVPARVQNSIARREQVGGLLRPVAAPDEVLEAQNQVREMVSKALQKGRDFDTIPGTNKPTLLKPGAERINAAYGLAAEYHLVEREIDHDRPVHYVKRTWEWGQRKGEKIWTETPGQSEGLYRYVVECRLIHRASGIVIGQGIGSCSTMESKYIDRPRDLENTVLKMASKRAYIAATLNTHGLSDQFTQDVEDNPQAFGGEAAPNKQHSSTPIAEQQIGFGKYGQRTWKQVAEADPSYVEWAINNSRKLTEADKEALQALLTYDDPAPGFPDDSDDLPF